MSLHDLMEYVRKGWVFNKRTYPRIKKNNATEFAIKHVSEHMAKTTGKIVAAIEPYDHGLPMDLDAIQRQTAYALINTLRMASLVGMTDATFQAIFYSWRQELLSKK